MRTFAGSLTGWIVPGLFLSAVRGYAPPENKQDANVHAIRGLSDIRDLDQKKIADWVMAELEICTDAARKDPEAALVQFRTRFHAQYSHQGNSPQFVTQLVVRTSEAAVLEFAKADLDPTAARALAHVLAGMGRLDAWPGLIAGLKSADPVARYVCAKGLGALRDNLVADKENTGRLTQTIQALRAAGEKENQGVVLNRMYEALAYPGQVPQVFDAYLALFDARLTVRRGPAKLTDGAEIPALEFFSENNVLKVLTPEQKSQLAGRIAVFMRLDAERYQTAELAFEEMDALERMLDSAEEILSILLPDAGKNGKVRTELQNGGHGTRAAVFNAVQAWVGNPAANAPGPLNQPPWDVPVGAP